MTMSRLLLIGGFLSGAICPDSAFAQFGTPRIRVPKVGKDDSSRQPQQRREDGPQPAGVPAPADNPLFDAFRKLEQQPVYHQRMTITTSDTKMAETMAQMGFGPAETIVAGDAKQVSMHFQMPAL